MSGAVSPPPVLKPPNPQLPMREVLHTSAAGRHICNGLQGWPQLRLIPDVDSPGMCLLSNCPASEGYWPPPLHLPLLHPSEPAETSFFPKALGGRATARTRASLVGGPTLFQPGPLGWGAGGLSSSPPLFFLGPGTGVGGRERNSGKLTRGERI